MASRSKANKSRIILGILIGLLIIFMFMQSFLGSDKSGAQSLNITTIINNFFSSLGINISFEHTFIRKLAHFLEFMLLGILTTTYAWTYITTPKKHILKILFVCMAAAITDETIQRFVPGRAALVSDINLDLIGSLTGIIIMLIFFFLVKRAKKIR